MRLGRRARYVAMHLPRVFVPGAEERKNGSGFIAGLRLHRVVVEAAAVEARWCAGLQASDAKRQLPQALGQAYGRGIARPAAGFLGRSDQYPAAQELV